MSHLSLLFESPLVAVHDSICTSPRSGRGPVKPNTTHVCLIRRGCFDYHLGSRTCFADCFTAIVHDEGSEFSTSHPTDGGDHCTTFTLEGELMAEMFDRRRNDRIEYRMSPAAHAGHLSAYAALKARGDDRLATEELALGLLQEVSDQSVAVRARGATGARRRRIVDAVKRFLNAELAANLGLAEVSREAGCSPYHLMRLFRDSTGQSLRGYRARLRVAAAMDRLAQGETDIAGLAADLGFANHSHLTNAFRRLIGLTPGELRSAFGHEDVATRRRLLDASLRAAA
jgi:AraC-like DNA-binding protein